MSVTDRQVRRLFVAMDTGTGVGLAAAKAGMHRNTAARHRATGLLPSEASAPRTYRTHADVFEADWPGIVQKLRESPVKARVIRSTPGSAKLVQGEVLARRPDRSRTWGVGCLAGSLRAREHGGISARPSRSTPGVAQEALRVLGGLRNESPSITTTWARWSSRSIAAEAMSSSLKSGYHSSTARFDVRIIAPRS